MYRVVYKCIVFYTCNLTISSVKISIKPSRVEQSTLLFTKKISKILPYEQFFPICYIKKRSIPHYDFLFTPSFYEFYIVSIFWNSFTSHSSRNTLSYLRYSKSSTVPSSPVSLYQLGFALVCVVNFPFCVLL